MLALGSLLVTAEARAIVVAPMCDEVGASVPAPIPALPNATGELRAASCDDMVESLRAAPPGPERAGFERAFDPGQRVLDAMFTLAQLPSRTLPIAEPDRPPVVADHFESVYRPPR